MCFVVLYCVVLCCVVLRCIVLCCDRNGSTSDPNPWQIYDDDDDDFFTCKFILWELVTWSRKKSYNLHYCNRRHAFGRVMSLLIQGTEFQNIIWIFNVLWNYYKIKISAKMLFTLFSLTGYWVISMYITLIFLFWVRKFLCVNVFNIYFNKVNIL